MATAFAALVSLQNDLSLVYDHPRHSFSFEEKQLDSLLDSVCFLIEFMESFDNSYGAAKEAAEALEGRIARAVQAADDVIQSHVVDQIHNGSTLGGRKRFRYLLDLQKAIEDVDFVRRKALNIQKLQRGFKVEQPTVAASTTVSSTPLTGEKNRMVGFDDQLLQLLDLLTGEPSSRRVIPIVGMGGIGKTTLAKNAFDNPYIVQYFDLRLWAKVSQEFNVRKILAELLASLCSHVKEETCSLCKPSRESSVADLGLVLHKSLFGRRYLIILDDTWSVEAWDQIQVYFPDTSCNGSRIVVTTRHTNVARRIDCSYIEVCLLNKDSSWDLFCDKTFEKHDCPSELVDIGKKIVEKCRGLPLAIVVVGGHLRKSSREVEYWESIANDLSPILNSGENERCLDILSLSYRHLTVHLKPCFLFLGIFSEDEIIPVLGLLNLWIDEGLIEDYTNCSKEETAWEYLEDLQDRNLVEISEKYSVNGQMICRIHDLLREMCLKIGKNDEFFFVLDTRRAINGEHRVVINGKIPKKNDQEKLFVAPRSTSHTRSRICEGGQLPFDMRIWNKVDSSTIDSQLVNLRYLRAHFDVFNLAFPLSLLWNLQTLIIEGIRDITAPYEIWEMLQLRHVEVELLRLPNPIPFDTLEEENVMVLENLHSLSLVENVKLSEEVCRRIPNIVTLEVVYENEPISYFDLHNLGCFKKLVSLECRFELNPKWGESASSLAFPISLKRLALCGCRLSWEEVTMKVGFLPHLEFLCLYKDSVTGTDWTPVEGGFPLLKLLSLHRLDLINWNADKSHFPILGYLGLFLPELDEFPSGIGEIPTLRSIFMSDCSMSSAFSAMRMAVEQEEQGNEWLQLHIDLEDEETLEEFKQKVEEEGLTSNNVHLMVKIL